jgi:hypothetical protein
MTLLITSAWSSDASRNSIMSSVKRRCEIYQEPFDRYATHVNSYSELLATATWINRKPQTKTNREIKDHLGVIHVKVQRKPMGHC